MGRVGSTRCRQGSPVAECRAGPESIRKVCENLHGEPRSGVVLRVTGRNMSGLELRSDVPLSLRPVGVLSALAWVLLPLLAPLLLLAAGSIALWLRADAQGRGDATLVLFLVMAAIGVPWMLVYAYNNGGRWHGMKLCRVAPPRSLLVRGGLGRWEGSGGVVATAVLHVHDGRLVITDRGRESALAGSIDSVEIGVLGRRLCCYAAFRAQGTTRRVQALGILPPEVIDNGMWAES